MTILLTGVGGSGVGHQFTFVSTGATYTGSANTAATAGYTATWTIEGTAYNGLNPGTVALSGDKTVYFDINPPDRLTVFDCRSNSLTGGLGRLDIFTSLSVLTLLDNALSGPFPNIANNTVIEIINVATNLFSGNLPDFSTNIYVSELYFGDNAFSGLIPSFATNNSLNTLQVLSNNLTGVVAGWAVPASLVSARFETNLLTQAAVDTILVAFVTAGATGAYTLNIGGVGNAVPSLTGATAKSTLQGRGWTVTTN